MSEELARSARANERAAFDREARRLGGRWSDALVATVAPAVRATLAHRLETPLGPTAALRSWMAQPEAGWTYVQWARDYLMSGRPPGNYTQLRNLLEGFHAFALVAADRCEAPWLWIELVMALRVEDRWIVRELRWPPGAHAWPAIRHALAAGISHRAMLGARLVREGGLGDELALHWLADRSLRPFAVDWLGSRVTEHEATLRARLVEADGGEREAIVRLLRDRDPHLALDGRRDTSDDGELQARLRADPTDATTAEVWADLLGDRGDPRGAHLALELAIRTAEPERALELSAAQASAFREHRRALWGKPGGFPYREKYRGRAALGFHSDYAHRVRGTATSILERIQAFVQHVTTTRAPHEIYLDRRLGPLDAAAQPTPLDPAATRLAEALGGEPTGVHDRHGRAIRRALPDQPLADEEAFIAACAALPSCLLAYDFAFTWPGSRVPLPHQEPAHYPDGTVLGGRLIYDPSEQVIHLHAMFPFEDFTDPAFVEVHAAIEATLGRVLTASRWCRYLPTVEGKRLNRRRAKFAR